VITADKEMFKVCKVADVLVRVAKPLCLGRVITTRDVPCGVGRR
jgi:hypothetical protein